MLKVGLIEYPVFLHQDDFLEKISNGRHSDCLYNPLWQDPHHSANQRFKVSSEPDLRGWLLTNEKSALSHDDQSDVSRVCWFWHQGLIWWTKALADCKQAAKRPSKHVNQGKHHRKTAAERWRGTSRVLVTHYLRERFHILSNWRFRGFFERWKNQNHLGS